MFTRGRLRTACITSPWPEDIAITVTVLHFNQGPGGFHFDVGERKATKPLISLKKISLSFPRPSHAVMSHRGSHAIEYKLFRDLTYPAVPGKASPQLAMLSGP